MLLTVVGDSAIKIKGVLMRSRRNLKRLESSGTLQYQVLNREANLSRRDEIGEVVIEKGLARTRTQPFSPSDFKSKRLLLHSLDQKR